MAENGKIRVLLPGPTSYLGRRLMFKLLDRPEVRLRVLIMDRRSLGDAAEAIPSTLTSLLSLHYTADAGHRWTVGGSLRRFAQDGSGAPAYGAGAEVGRLLARNLWLAAGWNVAGFSSAGSEAGRTERGPFVSLRFKFDEASLAQLSDLRLDR